MVKSLVFILVGLLSPSCYAFQISPIRTALPLSSGRRILGASTTSKHIKCLPIPKSSSSARWAAIHQSTNDDNGSDLDVDSPNVTIGCKHKFPFAKFFGIIKRRVISIGRHNFIDRPTISSFALSLSIFLLPFFVFPGSASAVRSGGRMGGSFSGGSRRRQSSSRSYSSPSRSRSSRSYSSPSRSSSQLNSSARSRPSGGGGGYSRGYSRGYPRPNIIISPRMGYRRCVKSALFFFFLSVSYIHMHFAGVTH